MIHQKICAHCNELKPIDFFNKAPQNKDGYNGKCKLCIQTYQRLYRTNNKEKNKEGQKKWYLRNQHKKRNKTKQYKLNHKEKTKEYNKQYKINNRNKINEWSRNYEPSLNSKISTKLSVRIRAAIKYNNSKKFASTNKLLGCTIPFFKEYIESKFTKGMSWENHGEYGWHFDHIIPCASFDLSDPEQQKLCFHYTNYQPLWATTEIAIKHGEDSSYIGNLEKGNKIHNVNNSNC